MTRFKIGCQVCLDKYSKVSDFKAHVRGREHQQQMEAVFQREFRDWVIFSTIVVMEHLTKHDMEHPIIGLSLVTLCFSSELKTMFYLCHVCEEKCSQGEILDHLFSAAHYSNYYSYTNPDVLGFSWTPTMDLMRILRPVALEDMKRRGSGVLQVLHLTKELVEVLNGLSYCKVMHSLNQNAKLSQGLRDTMPKRTTIQMYQSNPNRKHPLLGLQHLVECICPELTEKQSYLCTLCQLSVVGNKIINHVLSFDHIYRYINAWHPSTLQSKGCYNDYASFNAMMLSYAKQAEEIHGTGITDMKQMSLKPALFTSVNFSCCEEALKKLESIRKERKESSLSLSVQPGDKLGFSVITSCKLHCQCCNLIFETAIQYSRHVKHWEHKQEVKDIFGTGDTDDQRGDIPFLGLYNYIKKTPKRTEPVIGVPLIVLCLNTMAPNDTVYVCFACKESFPDANIRKHLRSRTHLIFTLMYQNPLRLPFAWETDLHMDDLNSLAWEEERDKGEKDMILKIFDFRLHNPIPTNYESVFRVLGPFQHHLKNKVPVAITLGKLQQSKTFPLLGQSFLVKHSVYSEWHQSKEWGFLCLLCRRTLFESEMSAHVFSREHVTTFLERAHPGSLDSGPINAETLLNMAKQASKIHCVSQIQIMYMQRPIWKPFDYPKAVSILTAAKKRLNGEALVPILPAREKLVPTEILKDHAGEMSQEQNEMTITTEEDMRETTMRPIPGQKETEPVKHSLERISDHTSDSETSETFPETKVEIRKEATCETKTGKEAFSESCPEQMKKSGNKKHPVMGGEQSDVAVKLATMSRSCETLETTQLRDTDGGKETGIEKRESALTQTRKYLYEEKREQSSTLSGKKAEKRQASEDGGKETTNKRLRLCSEEEKTCTGEVTTRTTEESVKSNDGVVMVTSPYNSPGSKLWNFIKLKNRQPVVGLSVLFECHCGLHKPFYLCESCCLMIPENDIIGHITGYTHQMLFLQGPQNITTRVGKKRLRSMKRTAARHEQEHGYGEAQVVELDQDLYNEITKQNFSSAIKKLKKVYDQQSTWCEMQPTSVLSTVLPLDTPAIPNVQLQVTSVTQDIQISPSHPLVHQNTPLDSQPHVNSSTSELQLQVSPSTTNCQHTSPQKSQDMDPTRMSTDLWTYLNNSGRTEPIIGLSVMTEFQCPENPTCSYLSCECCSQRIRSAEYVHHLISAHHRYSYIKRQHPYLMGKWPEDLNPRVHKRELCELAKQLEKKEGCGRLKVLEAKLGDSGDTDAQPSSTSAAISIKTATAFKTKGTCKTIEVTPETTEGIQMAIISKSGTHFKMTESTGITNICPTASRSTEDKTILQQVSKSSAATTSSNAGTALKSAVTSKSTAAIPKSASPVFSSAATTSKSATAPKALETLRTGSASKTTPERAEATCKTAAVSKTIDTASKSTVTTITAAQTGKTTIFKNTEGSPRIQWTQTSGGSNAYNAAHVKKSNTPVSPSLFPPIPAPSVQKTPTTDTSDPTRSKRGSSKSQLNVGSHFLVTVTYEKRRQVYCKLCSLKLKDSAHMTSLRHRSNYVRYNIPGWTASDSELEWKMLKEMTRLAKRDKDAGLSIQRVEVNCDEYRKLASLPEQEALGELEAIMRQRGKSQSSSSATNPEPECLKQKVPSTGPHEASHPANELHRSKSGVARLSTKGHLQQENAQEPHQPLVQFPAQSFDTSCDRGVCQTGQQPRGQQSSKEPPPTKPRSAMAPKTDRSRMSEVKPNTREDGKVIQGQSDSALSMTSISGKPVQLTQEQRQDLGRFYLSSDRSPCIQSSNIIGVTGTIEQEVFEPEVEVETRVKITPALDAPGCHVTIKREIDSEEKEFKCQSKEETTECKEEKINKSPNPFDTCSEFSDTNTLNLHARPEAPRNPDARPEALRNPDARPEAPQNPDARPEALRNPDARPEAPRYPDTCPEAPRNLDARPEAPRNRDARPEAPRNPDTCPEAPQIPEPQVEAPQIPEPQVEAPQYPDARPEALRNPDARPEAPRYPDTCPEAPRNLDARPEAPRNRDARPEAPRNPDTCPEAPQIPEPQVEAPQIPEPQVEAPQYPDAQVEAPQYPDAQVEALRNPDARPEAPQNPDTCPEAPRNLDARPEAPRNRDARPEAPRIPDARPEAPQIPEPQVEAPQIPEPQVEAPQYPDAQVEAPQYPDAQVEAPQYPDAQVEAPRNNPKLQDAQKPMECPERNSPIVPSSLGPGPPPFASLKETAALCSTGPTQTGENPSKHLKCNQVELEPNVPQVLQSMSSAERTVDRSNLYKYLKVLGLDTQPIIGLGSVLEYRVKYHHSMSDTFYLCISCSKTLPIKLMCEHMVSTEHQVSYMWKHYSQFMSPFWETELTQEMKLELLKDIASILSDREMFNKMDAQEVHLSPEEFKEIRMMTFDQALSRLQAIYKNQNQSELVTCVTSKPGPVTVQKELLKVDVNLGDKEGDHETRQREVRQAAKHHLEEASLTGDMEGVKLRRISSSPVTNVSRDEPSNSYSDVSPCPATIMRPVPHVTSHNQEAKPAHTPLFTLIQWAPSQTQPKLHMQPSDALTPLAPEANKGPFSDAQIPSIVDGNTFAHINVMREKGIRPPNQASQRNAETTTSTITSLSKVYVEDDGCDSEFGPKGSELQAPPKPLKSKRSHIEPLGENTWNYEIQHLRTNSVLSTDNWSPGGYSGTGNPGFEVVGDCPIINKPKGNATVQDYLQNVGLSQIELNHSKTTNQNPSRIQQSMGYNVNSYPNIEAGLLTTNLRTNANPNTTDQQFMGGYKGSDYTGENRGVQLTQNHPTLSPSDPLFTPSHNTTDYSLNRLETQLTHHLYLTNRYKSSSQPTVEYTAPDNPPVYSGSLNHNVGYLGDVYPSQICPQQSVGQVPVNFGDSYTVCQLLPQYSPSSTSPAAVTTGTSGNDNTYFGLYPFSTSANHNLSQTLTTPRRHSSNTVIQTQNIPPSISNPPEVHCPPATAEDVVMPLCAGPPSVGSVITALGRSAEDDATSHFSSEAISGKPCNWWDRA
ncbi:uncharacterized protein ACJ7VT_000444 isoform 2-T2 [Polymixia lowei]